MDVVRLRRGAFAPAKIAWPVVVAVLAGAAGWSALTMLRPHAAEPLAGRASLVTDVVRRGELVRSVRAPGTLVPERVRVAASSADGTVDAIPVRVGSTVGPDSTIATMRNPDLDAAVVDAAAQLAAARAELASAREEANAAQLDQQAVLRSAVANARQTREQARSSDELHAQGLIADVQYRLARIKDEAAQDEVALGRRKVVVAAAQARAKAAVAQAKVDQLAALLQARRAQLATLVVRAGASGVVQSLQVERGARVAAGTQIARIVGQHDLKATLQVAEAEIRDVVPGLAATVEVQNAVVRGHVARVDPAAQNGAIAVDVNLDGALPAGARPDLQVEGTVVFERLRDAVSIARPVNAADNAAVDLYVMTDGGTRAVRTHVRLGRGSLERVQVVAGLSPGATVIVSDTSAFEDAPALRVR
jgi:HlyD family secretion protein